MFAANSDVEHGHQSREHSTEVYVGHGAPLFLWLQSLGMTRFLLYVLLGP